MKIKKLKPRLSTLIIFFLAFFLVGVLFNNLNPLMFINYKNKYATDNYYSGASDKNISEVTVAPYWINTPKDENVTFFPEASDYDVKLAMLSNNDRINNTYLNQNLNSLTPNILMCSLDTLKASGNALNNIKQCNETHIIENINDKNKLAYIYVNMDSLTVGTMESTVNSIKEYTRLNFATIVFLDSKNLVKNDFIDLLVKSGVTVLITTGDTNASFELRKKSLILYNLYDNKSSYTPLVDIVFDSKKPISIGLKLFINDVNNREQVINNVNSKIKGFTKKIKESFTFIDIY